MTRSIALRKSEALTKVNPDCLISVQTNGAVLNNKVKEYLEKGRFEIGISLDSIVKETYEDIRVNAKFETVMKNVEYFAEYCKRKGTGLRLTICVMRSNWKDLPEYVNMCNRLNAYACFHKVFNPTELSLVEWDATNLNQVFEYLSDHTWKPTNVIEQMNVDHYNDYLRLIGKWLDVHQRKEKASELYAAKDLGEMYFILQKAIDDHARTSNLDVAETTDLIEGKLRNATLHLAETDHREFLKRLLQSDPGLVFNRAMNSDGVALRNDVDNFVATFDQA